MKAQDEPWKENEKSFHLQQSKLRSRVKILNKRPGCFDYLLQALMVYEGETDPVSLNSQEFLDLLQAPHSVLKSCSRSEMEIARAAMEIQAELDNSSSVRKYWKSLLYICDFLLYPQEIDQECLEKIGEIIEKKSDRELWRLLKDIDEKMSRERVDLQYWQYILKRIKALQSERYLLELAVKSVPNPLVLPSSNPNTFASESPILYSFQQLDSLTQDCNSITTQQNLALQKQTRKKVLKELIQNLPVTQQIQLKKNPLQTNEKQLQTLISNNITYKSQLEDFTEEQFSIQVKKQKIKSGQEEFSQIIQLPAQIEDWHHKYRPRRPKYFNRVKTGYEWTKHNQKYYDAANPPPKVVLGYKFNVFYPYLLDKAKAPQFYLEPDQTIDTCVIRFHSGPPYQDIAFRIINREWDFSDRNGFKCFFDKGILHLYFNFKRHRYKR